MNTISYPAIPQKNTHRTAKYAICCYINVDSHCIDPFINLRQPYMQILEPSASRSIISLKTTLHNNTQN